MFLVIVALLITPFVAFAAIDVNDLIDTLTDIAFSLIPVVATLALLYFFWGLAKFILRAGDETELAKGKQIMIWGIAALFVITTIWGILVLLQSTFVAPGTATIPVL